MSPSTAMWLLPWLVFVPLIGAGVAASAPRLRRGVALLAGSVNLGLIALLTWTVAAHDPVDLALSGWAPPVGIALRLDAWAAAFLLMTALVGLAVSWFATGPQAATARGSEGFWTLWLLLLAGLNAVYLTADLFNTYVALELITVAAVGLVALGGRASWSAALRYLFVAVLGSLLVLMAVALAYAQTGTLQISQAVQHDLGVPVAATVLASAGLALKAALVPLHGWLPPAHAGAPTAVSPLMSALVVKASFYVLWRWWSAAPPESLPLPAGTALGVLGGVAILWGSWQALRQDHLKRVIAYSTVAQVGYFFLVFPLLASDAQSARLAASGVVIFAVAHGLAKAAMFLAAGALMYQHGTDALSALRGAVGRAPVPTLTLAIAGVSLAGLPPTLAFAGKWQLLRASLEVGHWWWFAVILLGGLLTCGYVARVLRILFTAEHNENTHSENTSDEHTNDEHTNDDADHHPTRPPVPRRMAWAGMCLALLVLLGGFTAVPLIELLDASPLEQSVLEVSP